MSTPQPSCPHCGRTVRTRACFARDAAWLRRARRHFCGLLRRWVDSARNPLVYRQRVFAVGKAMVAHKLLAGGQGMTAAFSVMSNFARADGINWCAWRDMDQRRKVAAMWPRDLHNWQRMRKAR